MSIKHTSTTVGTKSLEAIVAEFRATIPDVPINKPAGPGWIEVNELRAKLGMGETAFSQLAKKQVDAGVWLRVIGTKLGRTGIMRSTTYYHVASNVAQIAPLAPKPAKRGA